MNEEVKNKIENLLNKYCDENNEEDLNELINEVESFGVNLGFDKFDDEKKINLKLSHNPILTDYKEVE